MTTQYNRYMIATTKAGDTKAGRPVAHLFSTDTRLEYPVLVLFDLSMLSTVGIDPDTLNASGTHRRYWAYYTESEKTTSEGNPYRDVQYLEPIEQLTQPTAADLAPVMAELSVIRALLEQLVTGSAPAPPDRPLEGQPSVTTTKKKAEPETHVSHVPHPGQFPVPEAKPIEATSETPTHTAMRNFYEIAAPAIEAEQIAPESVNELVQVANADGWIEALASLQAALSTAHSYGLTA